MRNICVESFVPEQACGAAAGQNRAGGAAPRGRGWDGGRAPVPSAFFSTRSKFLINNSINVTACHRLLSLSHQGQGRGHTFSRASSRPGRPASGGLVPMETAPRRTHAAGNASLCVCTASATRAAARGPGDSLRPLPFLAGVTSQPPSGSLARVWPRAPEPGRLPQCPAPARWAHTQPGPGHTPGQH